MPAFGFHKRETPAAYIEQNYQQNLIEHIQEFLLKYIVIGFLHQEIRRKKILLAGQPRLKSISMSRIDAQFNFELSLYPPISFQEWKYLPFKAQKEKTIKILIGKLKLFYKKKLQPKKNIM